MSSYGEKRDKRDEIMSGDLAAMQKGIQSSRGSRGPADRKKTIMYCGVFIIFLVIALTVVILISL